MKSLAVRSGALAFVSTVVGGALLQLLLPSFEGAPLPWGVWVAAIAVAASGAAVLTGVTIHLTVARRVARVARFVERQTDGASLERLPRMGEDEVGRAAEAVNQMIASMTSLQVDIIDQGRELADAREAVELRAELEEKNRELEQRLRERALLFDVLRASATEPSLDGVLDALVTRLGPALRLRELALLLREHGEDGQDRFVVRAAWGFESPVAVLGRSVAVGEGIAGEVAQLASPVVIPDVSLEPDYLAFWGEAPREGSFAGFPILNRGDLLGIVAMTRGECQRMGEVQVRFVSALADQMAFAIRHAGVVDELRALSTHDELTGLPNRRLFRQRLGEELARVARHGDPVSVLAIDIDHFKKLNDRCGHPTGDRALAELALRMRTSLREIDTPARVGGEEFLVLLPATDLGEALSVAEKLRAAVVTEPMPGGEGQPGGRLTISVGAAALAADEDADALLARADEALYAAKARGRDKVVASHGPGRAETHRPPAR